MFGRETLIHAKQVRGEQRRLVTAGAGPHLEDGVARIIPVAWQQQQLQGLHLDGKAGFDLLDLGAGHLHDLGIAVSLVDHLRRRHTVCLQTAYKVDLFTDRP